MDTKLRKSKAVFSFFCLLFSMGVLVASGFVAIGIVLNYDDIKSGLADASKTDYQEMGAFQNIMSEYLYSALDSIPLEESLKNPEEAIAERAQEYSYDSVEDLLADNNYESVDDWVKYRRSKSFFENIQRDTAKNLLYQAGTVKNPRAYTNGGKNQNLYEGELPEGYNFRLIYNGKKVTIEKDGKMLNVYGDGFYKSDSPQKMWRVPGYENMPANVNPDYRVCLLARTVPAEPVEGYSRLYNLVVTRSNLKYMLLAWLALGVAALAALAPALGWKKYRKEAWRRLGAWSGRILFEVKLACAFLLFLFDVALFEAVDDLIVLICGVFSLIGWTILVNDIHWNHKFWKNNLFVRFRDKRRERDRMLPVQQRLIKRLRRFLKIELTVLLVGGTLCVLSGPGCLIFAPLSLFLLWYYASEYQKEYRYITDDIGRLINQIEAIRNGDATPPLVLPVDADMRGAAEGLNEIRTGVENAVEERLRSERMKIELITNVSHDIKTPLTSIISYVNLLKQEDLPDYVKDYISVLDEKSVRLKNMVQDIFEVSKATSGNMEMHMEQLGLGKLVRQTLADMGEQISNSPVLFKVDMPEQELYIRADGGRLYRVFQNLINNALMYSMEGTRVFVTLQRNGDSAIATIKNVSRCEIDNPEELTERFVRGDAARTTSGSGLGLSIAKSFTEACGGTFSLLIDADLFTARVEFPVIHNPVISKQEWEEEGKRELQENAGDAGEMEVAVQEERTIGEAEMPDGDIDEGRAQEG